MEESLRQLFSKHYKRIENDLKQINGYVPLCSVALSAGFKNLEQDIINLTRDKKNGLD